MKNIHTLRTDKPSKLIKLSNGELRYNENSEVHSFLPKNIYITSDEEIKEGDWLLKCKNINDWNFKSGELEEKDYSYFAVKCVSLALINPEDKKIVLTDNKDLIADGVQEVPEDFLQWFIKNSSCEKVEVKPLLSNNGRALFGYKIIIPKEEDKNICIQTGLPCGMQCFSEEICNTAKYKQETPKQIAERYYGDEVSINAFIIGYNLAKEEFKNK